MNIAVQTNDGLWSIWITVGSSWLESLDLFFGITFGATFGLGGFWLGRMRFGVFVDKDNPVS